MSLARATGSPTTQSECATPHSELEMKTDGSQVLDIKWFVGAGLGQRRQHSQRKDHFGVDECRQFQDGSSSTCRQR